ncbi:hypothetical protein N1851_031542 [Merluccius polli]|uniref:Uncharacterized protein n=1 Tax=Merluccius polli TaxID=89951 RepID=A0AA47M3Q4_MERPO|nr:hypothetical protein N1851_031542 [Merluccius polli]
MLGHTKIHNILWREDVITVITVCAILHNRAVSPYLFTEGVQSGADLLSQDPLGLQQLGVQCVAELALSDHVIGAFAEPRPVELGREAGQHGAKVLQVVDHDAQLALGFLLKTTEEEEQQMKNEQKNEQSLSVSNMSLLSTHHVDGDPVVRVLREHPDTPLQDVTDSCSHSLQMGWMHATRSTADELCLMGTVPT